jgi:branched-chain amino acid transport system permease protein
MASPISSGIAAIRSRPYVPAVLAALLLLQPWLGVDQHWIRQTELVVILALIVSGLNLSFGFGGELALGQVAIYAGGAYVTAILAEHGVDDMAVTGLAAIGLALVIGLVSGLPGIRLGGWALAMVSFFLVLVLPNIINQFPDLTGGFGGIAGVERPTVFGISLESTNAFYVTVVVLGIIWFAFMRNLVLSRYGVALRVLRQSPVLARSLGISVYRLKVTVYLLAAIPAGVAGMLFTYLDGFISPGSFTFSVALSILAACILGGKDTIYGPILGAVFIRFGPSNSESFEKYSLVAYGAFLVIFGLFLSGGVGELWRRLVSRFGRRTGQALDGGEFDADAAIPTLRGIDLRLSGVGKSFGGNLAVDAVSLTARAGHVTALIGPNGSGKTTLLNLVSGYYTPSSGTISLGDERIDGRASHSIARAGVARTFQTPNIPEGLSVGETVESARFARHNTGILATVLRLPRSARARKDDHAAAEQALDAVGLGQLGRATATAVPLGTRRLLEVARAIALEPAVLLLDEPASGLDSHEVEELARLIRAVAAAGAAVVLVEHNFQMVLSASDHIYVLAEGAVIAEGDPATIRDDEAVARSYLGIVTDADGSAAADQLDRPSSSGTDVRGRRS